MELWSEIFKYDEDSPTYLSNKVDRHPRQRRGTPVGWLNNHGYYVTSVKQSNFLVHRIIYTILKGPIPEGMQVDHINGVRTDNFIDNLRLVTAKENQRNMGKNSRNTSGITGVSRIEIPGRKGEIRCYWAACWKALDGRQRRENFSIAKLGEEAAKAAAVARRQYEINSMNESGAGYLERHGV